MQKNAVRDRNVFTGKPTVWNRALGPDGDIIIAGVDAAPGDQNVFAVDWINGVGVGCCTRRLYGDITDDNIFAGSES